MKDGSVYTGRLISESDSTVRARVGYHVYDFPRKLVADVVMPTVHTDRKMFMLSFNNSLSYLQMITGYQHHMKFLSPNLYMGLETGLESIRQFTIPVHATARYFIANSSRFTPFVNLSGGWAFGAEEYNSVMDENRAFTNESFMFKVKGGPHLSTELGLMKSNRNHRGMYMKLGYRYQHTRLEAIDTPYISLRTYHRLSVAIGMFLFY